MYRGRFCWWWDGGVDNWMIRDKEGYLALGWGPL